MQWKFKPVLQSNGFEQSWPRSVLTAAAAVITVM